MNGMVGGLSGSKMSSSDPDSKIDLLDSADIVSAKLNKAFCEEGNTADNPILQFMRAVIFPINNLKNAGYVFRVVRPEKFGGVAEYNTYLELESAFADKSLHPGDLKKAAAEAFNVLLSPIREAFANNPALIELTAKAYPPVQPKIAAEISRVCLRVGKILEVTVHPEKEVIFWVKSSTFM